LLTTGIYIEEMIGGSTRHSGDGPAVGVDIRGRKAGHVRVQGNASCNKERAVNFASVSATFRRNVGSNAHKQAVLEDCSEAHH
jgi:hypothetical protein